MKVCAVILKEEFVIENCEVCAVILKEQSLIENCKKTVSIMRANTQLVRFFFNGKTNTKSI